MVDRILRALDGFSEDKQRKILGIVENYIGDEQVDDDDDDNEEVNPVSSGESKKPGAPRSILTCISPLPVRF